MNTRDGFNYQPSIGNTVDFYGFGIVGSGGVGIVANFTMGNSCSNTGFCSYNSSKGFMATVAYYSMYPKGVVNWTGGTVTIDPSTYYQY
jgi:hypothetical protein